MKQYICLASDPWRAAPTRVQHFMSRLKNAEILYFEPPTPGGHDYRERGRRVRPGLTVYTLPPASQVDERYVRLFRRNMLRQTEFIESKLERHRFREPVLWLTSPKQVHFLDYLAYRGLVYDCDREWSGLPLRWESDLALAADVIFAASPMLVDRLSPCNNNICLLPNGANPSMFSRAGLRTPPELRGLKVPVLGYVGAIWRDLDLSPVWETARRHREWAFVFLGRTMGEHAMFRALKALPNVAFLGWKSPVDLPDYLSRFDVCLNLYRRSEIGTDIIAQRLYEYLSTGKPIVSMLWEDQVEPFPDVVYGAHTHAEFAHMCATALQERGDWASKRRLEYGRAAAWSTRAEELCRVLSAIGLY